MTYPVFTNTGNYIVYETGLVIPPGAENISFNFVGIEIENTYRSVGTRLSHYVYKKFGNNKLDENTVQINIF